MSNLKDGNYDEAESHNGFLEALNAWRKKPDDKQEETPGKKKMGKKELEQSWKHQ